MVLSQKDHSDAYSVAAFLQVTDIFLCRGRSLLTFSSFCKSRVQILRTTLPNLLEVLSLEARHIKPTTGTIFRPTSQHQWDGSCISKKIILFQLRDRSSSRNFHPRPTNITINSFLLSQHIRILTRWAFPKITQVEAGQILTISTRILYFERTLVPIKPTPSGPMRVKDI